MRVRQPYFRKQTQSWYVKLDDRDVPLGKDEEAAWETYHELMAERVRTGKTQVASDSVVLLVNRYLDWLQKNRAPTTFDRRLPILRSFGRHIGPKLKASRLKPFHVQDWIDNHYSDPKRHSDTYRNTLITAVKAAFGWAVDQGHLASNPIARMKKPAATMRELYLPAVQWTDVLDAARDEPLKEFIFVMLDSGARVQEMFKAEARHLDRAQARLVFPKEESKGKKRHRVVYLPPESLAIVCRLADEHPEGKLFRNSRGRPWNRNSMRCRFRRLKSKLKLPSLCATTLRHSFAYHRLVSGQPLIAVEKLMGHVDGRMLEQRYSHLHQDTTFMKDQAAQLAMKPISQTPSREPQVLPMTGRLPTDSASSPAQSA